MMAESSAGSSFDCPICSDSFKVNGDLVDHLCEHLSYRKYRCGSCEKTFITERKQKKHCEKNSHFRIHQPSINIYNELLLEQFQEELAFLRGGGDIDQLIAFKQNSLWKLQNVTRDLPSPGRTEVPVLSTSTNSAKEKRVMSSTPQDANGVVNKNTASSRTIQSARSIVNTESIPSPPSRFTNNVTMAANPTTPLSRSRGTTWYAQPKPIPLGSSDSEFDDDDITSQNAQSRIDVAQRKVTPSASSSAMSNTSISTPKSTVVQGGSNICGNGIDKRVVSSSPLDAKREIVHKKTTNSFTIQSARSIVKEEIVPSPPSGFTNKTKAANPTTPSSRSYGTSWYAQPKPMPICSSDSESDDDDSPTQNTQSREDVAQRKVTPSANTCAMSKTSISTPKSTVVQGVINGKEKRVMASSPQDANRVVNKKTTTNRSIPSARSIVKTEPIPSRPFGFANNTVAANPTTPSSRSRGTTWYAQPKPIPLGSSDSESDDDDSPTQNTLSRGVAQRNVSLSANSSAMKKCSATSSPVVIGSSRSGVNKKIATNGTERNTWPTSKSAATTSRSSALVNNSRENALAPIRCGATSDAQLQPITLGSSDSDCDEDADQIIPRREDVVHCTVDTSDEENTTGGSSSKRNASVESRKLAVVRSASDSDDDGIARSSGSTTERVRKEATKGAPVRKRDFRKYTQGKSIYGEGEEFALVTLSGSKMSSLSWMFKPVDNVTCEICHSNGPGDYVSRRRHVCSCHMENDDLTLKRYCQSLEAQMQKAYPGMTYSDLHCQYPGCPEKEYGAQHLRRTHVMKDHSAFDLCCVIDGCSFLSTNAREMELHLKGKHAMPNGSKSLSPLLAAAFVNERRSKHHQLAVVMEFCFPCAIPLQLASQSELKELLGETRFHEDFDLLKVSLSTITDGTLSRKDCNDDDFSSSCSDSSTRRRTGTTSCSPADGGFGTTSEIAIDFTISSFNWELFLHSSKATCQFCKHEGSGDYAYRKYHVALKHVNPGKLRDTDYYDVLQAKMLEAYPGMTYSDMQCQYPGCGRMYTRQNSRYTHVWNDHNLKDMRCIFRECPFLSSGPREMEEHLKVAHDQPNGSKSLGIVEVAAFVNVRRRKIRQVAAISECCFPCPIPLHASRTALRQLMIDALGKARKNDESGMVRQHVPTAPNSNKPVKRKRGRVRPDEFSDQFTVVERLPLAMRTITPEDRARMMKFAPMRRRWPSSSESESDDEEDMETTAQGVVTSNDADGNVIKASGTAAKVSKIEISSSDGSDL